MIKGLLPAWPWRKRGKGGTLALTLNDNSLRYVLASQSDERGATLTAWGTELRGNQTRDAFMKRAKTILPTADRVIAVLDSRDYQVLQLESPSVPPEELQSAIRWRAMEFMEGSPNDYTLDVLSLEGEPSRAAKVIAVVARNDTVRARMLDCKALDQPLSVIEIAETTQRNLLHAVLLGESTAPNVAAALVADGGRALMIIAVRGQLYFFRRFEFDTDIFGAVDDLASELIGNNAGAEAVLRSLTQLHRGLDLWDDTYPSLPLGTFRVDAGVKTDAIIARLKPETGVDTQPLKLAAIFKVPVSRAPPPWLDAAYLPLLGALLRPEMVP